MTENVSKEMTLAQAVERFVPNGSHLSIGGFTVNRNPMAAVYEIIRRKVRGLHVYAHSNGQGVDELIGGGCVARLEIAYAGTGRFAPTCVRFRKAVESGEITVEDYSNYQMTLRFQAGAMGVPFLPTRSGLGSDLLAQEGFDAALRGADPKLPPRKMCVLDNPFETWGGVSQVVLVPAINPDVTIVHVQKADPFGTLRIEGLPFADVEQIKSARHVIATCEELVESDELRRESNLNQIPFFNVDAVVQVPYGAYPTACYRYYDYDSAYLNAYRHAASDERRYQAHLDRCVFGVRDTAEFMALQGDERKRAIAADERTGYAVGLDRR